MCEKDVRFQEQVQKHEEELLRVTAQSQVDRELQQVPDSDAPKMTKAAAALLIHI